MKTLAVLAVGVLALSGCAGVGVAAAGAVMGAGIDHTLSGISYKTFTAPADEVHLAILDSLTRMGMKIREDGATPEGWRTVATAREREIEIDLEKLTPTATRMRIIANRGEIFFKDRATAAEIILQTALSLDNRKINVGQAIPAKAGQAAPVKAVKGTKKS